MLFKIITNLLLYYKTIADYESGSRYCSVPLSKIGDFLNSSKLNIIFKKIIFKCYIFSAIYCQFSDSKFSYLNAKKAKSLLNNVSEQEKSYYYYWLGCFYCKNKNWLMVQKIIKKLNNQLKNKNTPSNKIWINLNKLIIISSFLAWGNKKTIEKIQNVYATYGSYKLTGKGKLFPKSGMSLPEEFPEALYPVLHKARGF